MEAYACVPTWDCLSAHFQIIFPGWFYTWYSTYPPGPGRGLTLWDPEFLAAVGLIVPSIAYVLFNAKNLTDPQGTMENTMYLVVSLSCTMRYAYANVMCLKGMCSYVYRLLLGGYDLRRRRAVLSDCGFARHGLSVVDHSGSGL